MSARLVIPNKGLKKHNNSGFMNAAADPGSVLAGTCGSNRDAVVLLSNSMHYWCLVTGPPGPIASFGRCAIVRRYRRQPRRHHDVGAPERPQLDRPPRIKPTRSQIRTERPKTSFKSTIDLNIPPLGTAFVAKK